MAGTILYPKPFPRKIPLAVRGRVQGKAPRGRGVGLLALSLNLYACFLPSPPLVPEPAPRPAREILAEKGYWEALPYYFKEIEEAGNSPRGNLLRYELALAALKEGERDVALDLLASILAREPSHPLALPLYRSLSEPQETPSPRAHLPSHTRVPVLLQAPQEFWLETSAPLALSEGVILAGGFAGSLDQLATTLPLNQVLSGAQGEPFLARVNGYLSSLRIKRIQEGVVLELPLEDYLVGVLSREMGGGFPLEALKAQAVCSRTYLYQLSLAAPPASEYLIRGDITHQAFTLGATNPAILQAIQSTRGEILTYEGKPALVFFHADNGGISEDPRYVWGLSLPYYRIQRDPFSNQTPPWSYRIPVETLTRLFHLPRVERLELHRSPSGRVMRLVFAGRRFRREIPGNEFRLILGSTKLRSLQFTVQRRGDELLFQGRGYGHGVGMSQWGARRMAEQGLTYKEILQYYYPGTLLTHIPELVARGSSPGFSRE